MLKKTNEIDNSKDNKASKAKMSHKSYCIIILNVIQCWYCCLDLSQIYCLEHFWKSNSIETVYILHLPTYYGAKNSVSLPKCTCGQSWPHVNLDFTHNYLETKHSDKFHTFQLKSFLHGNFSWMRPIMSRKGNKPSICIFSLQLTAWKQIMMCNTVYHP